MKARIAEFQEGLDKFCENESWRMIYESAPDGAKEEMELEFFDNWRRMIGKPLDEEEFLKYSDLCKTPLKVEDLEFQLTFAKDARLASLIKKQIEELKSQGERHGNLRRD